MATGYLPESGEMKLQMDSRPPVRKRRRVVISCLECHRRKQKCDRNLPCGNCVIRNKEHSCSYEAEAPTSRGTKPAPTSPSPIQTDLQSRKPPSPATAAASESLASMAAQLGYSHSGSSTMGLLKRIETAPQQVQELTQPHTNNRPDSVGSTAVRDKYKSLVRQLPSKMYIDRLVRIFFAQVNHMYNFIDEAPFYQRLAEWNRMPFSTLSAPDGGPAVLSQDQQAFPALLFQMFACAVLVLPEDGDMLFDALKYAGEMTFEDLARDYSESGLAVVALFGKDNVSITTVQAQFSYALFLKYTAKVTECWHSISSTIRDAQEIGMHRDSLDPKPPDGNLSSIIANQWLVQQRRKMYMILITWDVNMSVFLGRPDGGSWISTLPTLPVDCVEPKDRRQTPVLARDDDSPPSLYTKTLWLFQLVKPIKEILDLDRHGCRPKEFTKVDEVHRMIMDLDELKPAAFRLQNPDIRWDTDPELFWLPSSRAYFTQMHHFSLLALHRPYVFHRKESRSAALYASMEMLDVQRRNFDSLAASSWRNFNLFFGSFDALVMIASIYILFPQEHAEQRANAIRHFHWTMERYAVMRDRNAIAKSAQNVLAAIQARFTYAVGAQGLTSPAPSSSTDVKLPWLTPEASRSGSASSTSTAAKQNGYPAPSPNPRWATDWPSPSVDNLADMAPIHPTLDLLYNDLMVVKDPMPAPASNIPSDSVFQFGGDLEDNTLWQFLNQFPTGGPIVGGGV